MSTSAAYCIFFLFFLHIPWMTAHVVEFAVRPRPSSLWLYNVTRPGHPIYFVDFPLLTCYLS